ncbi:hypothetical protein FYK55_17155 [Roseiconus nitratireducens]|uniref:Lipoprotein n=1 Tax=Roseiconus nitratireducens TaxID=2605748 RepID=A0A5M6D362_9BACT|nr:hypothetical protein [Roseiconus nitratireducens]KAA5541924.1 hypothetical protein FYK55_17155 [Roseiconus nitratireducens]
MIKILVLAILVSFASVLLGCSGEPSRAKLNREALNRYVHPDGREVAHLTLEEISLPASNSLLYWTDVSLEDVDEWYTDKFHVSLREPYESDSGQSGLIFETDEESRDSMVYIFDTNIPSANDSLQSFLTAKRIKALPSKSCTVVVAYLDDPVQAIKLLHEFNGEEDDG